MYCGRGVVGKWVLVLKCNYQEKVTVKDLSAALAEGHCFFCFVTAAELMRNGEMLEVCGEEFSTDIVNGERVLTTIALCPECHKKFHLDANRNHNPCQIKARLSREALD